MTDKQWDTIIALHGTAPFKLIRAAAPFFRVKDGEPRSIVNISSTSGVHGNAGQANYALAVSAQDGSASDVILTSSTESRCRRSHQSHREGMGSHLRRPRQHCRIWSYSNPLDRGQRGGGFRDNARRPEGGLGHSPEAKGRQCELCGHSIEKARQRNRSSERRNGSMQSTLQLCQWPDAHGHWWEEHVNMAREFISELSCPFLHDTSLINTKSFR